MPLPDVTGWVSQQQLNGLSTGGYQIPPEALPYLSAEQIQRLGGSTQQNPVDAFIASLPPEVQSNPTAILQAASSDPSLAQAVVEKFGIQNAGGMTFENPYRNSFSDFAVQGAKEVLIPWGLAAGAAALAGQGFFGGAGAAAGAGQDLGALISEGMGPQGVLASGGGAASTGGALGGALISPSAIAAQDMAAVVGGGAGAAPAVTNALGSGASTVADTISNTGSVLPTNTLSNVPDWVTDYLIPGLGAVAGTAAADRASDAEVAAMDRALAENARQYDTTRADWAPWMDLGKEAIGNLRDPTKNFFASPNYEFVRNEGTRDIGNSFAARGGAASGNALKALAEFNSGLASGEFGSWYNRELSKAGLGTTGTGAVTNAGTNAANAAGNYFANQGASRASGVLGRYGAVAGGLGDVYRNYLYRRAA